MFLRLPHLASALPCISCVHLPPLRHPLGSYFSEINIDAIKTLMGLSRQFFWEKSYEWTTSLKKVTYQDRTLAWARWHLRFAMYCSGSLLCEYRTWLQYNKMHKAPVRRQTAFISYIVLPGVRVASQVLQCGLQSERSRKEDAYSSFKPSIYIYVI